MAAYSQINLLTVGIWISEMLL